MGRKSLRRIHQEIWLSSHYLRRFGVTLLNLAGVSPYIIYAITRHKIEGMSDINLLYTRPSIDDLREIIEYLN